MLHSFFSLLLIYEIVTYWTLKEFFHSEVMPIIGQRTAECEFVWLGDVKRKGTKIWFSTDRGRKRKKKII